MKKIPSTLLAAGLLLAPAIRAQQDSGMAIDIAVRSGIDDAEKKKRDHDPAYAEDLARHARLFLLASVKPAPSVEKLVNPVNAIALARELKRQLIAQGFQPARTDQKPEIIITVEYGRGWLSNPYSNSDQDKTITNLSDSDSLVTWHKLSFSRLEERRQWADQEKLIIQVRAWKYPPPTGPKKKLTMLWMTTMHVDDPDHRDLGVLYPKLLAAGAPYFDRHIEREQEVVTTTEIPEGRVKVGPAEVIEDKKPK